MAIVMRVLQWIFAGLGVMVLGASVVIGFVIDKGDIWVACSGQSISTCEGFNHGVGGGIDALLGGMVGLALILLAVLIAANTPRPVLTPRQPVQAAAGAYPQPGAQGQYPPFAQQNAPQPPFGS